jgi:isopentenyldiphosphate isomerase
MAEARGRQELDELVDVVDRDDHTIGVTTRQDAENHQRLLRASRVLVFTRDGRVAVQQRGQKLGYPGHFDIGAAETLKQGESYVRAARRGLHEELGISETGASGISEFFFWHFETPARKRLVRGFYCFYDGPLTPDGAEVVRAFYTTGDQLAELVQTQPFHPAGLYLLRQYHAEVNKGKVPAIELPDLFIAR